MLTDMTLNYTMVLLILLSMTIASVAIFLGWRRCFHPRIQVLAVQDDYEGPDGQLCGEITLKIDIYAPPVGVLHLWNFNLIAPKKFLERNIRMAFIVAKGGPVPVEWADKRRHDAIRRHGVLAPNEQCSVYVTVRMIVPRSQRKGRLLWYFFLDTKLSILYDVSGKGRKQKVPASRIGYVHDWLALPRLFENGDYRQVISNPRHPPKTIGLAAIQLLPMKTYSELKQEQYARGHELQFPFGTRDHLVNGQLYSDAFIDEWNACYDQYQKEIASLEDAD